MRDFVITTESNSDLSPEYIEENGIGVIPHYYTVDEEVYGDGREMTTKEFYDAMRAQKKAATMASNPSVIQERFSAYAEEGKDVLHISFSSALSGGYGNVVMVAGQVMSEHPQMRIKVVDTLAASLGEGLMIMKAVELRKQGATLDEVAAWIEEAVPHICTLFTVDDLNHLCRGGRLSKTSAVLGTLVDIKPLLYINDEGRLVPFGKTRGRRKSLSMLVKTMEERIGGWKDRQAGIGIVHGDCEEDAMYVAELVRKTFGEEEIVIRPIGPSIGAHSGPGAVGLIFLGDHR